MSLRDRFSDFCRNYQGAEDIDSIALSPEEENRRLAGNLQRADYFFNGRAIIAELKTLEIDPQGKVVEIMDQAGIGPDVLGKGVHIVEELFSGVPNGKKLFRKAVKAITSSTKNDFNNAARQVRDTKAIFDIKSADGLLIILNDSIEIAGPPIIYNRLARRLQKRDGEGDVFHQDITRVLYISEMHAIERDGADHRMNVTLNNPHVTEQHGVNDFVTKLSKNWAAECGHTFQRDESAEMEKIVTGSELFIDVS